MANETTGFGIRVQVTPDGGSAVTFKETEVTVQGYEGDEKIEQTTNANTKFRSFEPGDLIEKTALSGTGTYDPDQLASYKAALQIKGDVEVTFKSGRKLTDRGWLRSFTPTGASRGNMPLATFTLEFEGEDASGTDNEAVIPAP